MKNERTIVRRVGRIKKRRPATSSTGNGVGAADDGVPQGNYTRQGVGRFSTSDDELIYAKGTRSSSSRKWCELKSANVERFRDKDPTQLKDRYRHIQKFRLPRV